MDRVLSTQSIRAAALKLALLGADPDSVHMDILVARMTREMLRRGRG